jgi:hypothetical protein
LENFTTEVLVHLINKDKVFRRIFISHIIRDGRILRRFKRATAESQQSFGNGIVDIVLTSGESRVLVEVKITAGETETKIYGKGWVSQVQKYLDFKAGRVAYLTTKVVGTPILGVESKRFLGQTYFEDLYDHLVEAKTKLSDCGRLFLEFMKEKDMKSLEPFTKQDLRKPENAFSFAKKCEELLNEIRSEVEPEFRRIFRSRARFTSGHFSPTYESAYIYTKGKLSGHKKLKWLGISIWPDNESLAYGVMVTVLKTDVKKLSRHLKWTEEDGSLFNPRYVKPNMRAGRFIKPILADLKKLNRALKQAF